MAPRRKKETTPDVEPNRKRVIALLEERRGYIARRLEDRIADVDAQIALYGGADIATEDKPDAEGDTPAGDDPVDEGGDD